MLETGIALLLIGFLTAVVKAIRTQMLLFILNRGWEAYPVNIGYSFEHKMRVRFRRGDVKKQTLFDAWRVQRGLDRCTLPETLEVRQPELGGWK